ncbi:MAG: hypothetical protein WA660_01450 [Candidatus Acidiferrales bacterium]
MKKILLGIAALLMLVVPAVANCPVMVKCSIDGEYMSQEETYWNAGHESIKYSHDYYGANGKEHHYVIVSCDDSR